MTFTQVGRGNTYIAESADAPLPTTNIVPASITYFTDTQIYTLFDGTSWVEMPRTTVIALEDSEITASAAEINTLDGITASTAELNKMDGVTATTAELNITDGLTATAAELNQVNDGVGVSVTASNLTEVTDGSETALHQHLLADGADDVTVSAADLNTLSGLSTGLGVVRVARATFNPSANSGERTIAPHGLGVTIPDKAILVDAFIDVQTDFHDGASNLATVAIKVQAANDIYTAATVGGSWGAGIMATNQQVWTVDEYIKLTAAREITATVAVHALTTGKADIFIYYVVGQ